jgi:hypothetical protein
MSIEHLGSYEFLHHSDGRISTTTEYRHPDGRFSSITFDRHPSLVTIKRNPLFTFFFYPNRGGYEIMENDTKKIVYKPPPGLENSLTLELAEANDWELYVLSEKYKRKMTTRMHAAIYCELIQRACTPARLFQWNEGAAEQFPEEYAKYKV